MSMETTCLKCQTVFRVTTEQLNAHQGDVRCGVCGTLFNAFESLAPARTEVLETIPAAPELKEFESPAPASLSEQPVVEPAAPTEEMPAAEAVASQEPESIEIELPQPEIEDESFADFGAALASEQPSSNEPQTATGEIVPEPIVAEGDFADFASAFEPQPAEPVAETAAVADAGVQEAAAPEVEIPAIEPPPAQVVTAQSLSPKKSNAIKAELDAIEDIYAEFAKKIDLSPLPSATQVIVERQVPPGGTEQVATAPAVAPAQFTTKVTDEFEQSMDHDLLEPFNAAPKKSRSWLWGIAALPLVVALSGQVIYFYRVELAARYPASRPVLELACAQIHCDVPLPRNADLLKIESSDLEADTEFPSRVTLSSAISNRAAYRQAYPRLELTLTNHEDQAMARRIFTPAEYLAANIDAKLGMAANSEVAIRLNLDLGELNAVGYRLYVFYAGQR